MIFADLHEDGRHLYPGTGAEAETGRGPGIGTKLNIPLPAGAAVQQATLRLALVETDATADTTYTITATGTGSMVGFTYNINGTTELEAGFDAEREWARNFWSALEPYQTSVYVNFLMDEGADRVRAAYGRNYDRLTRVKRAYDPTNLFHVNQNIKPA